MNVWEPDDRVFLFGFSRGAYSVRVLAGFLYSFGLLHRGNDNLVPYAFRLFKSIRGSKPSQAQSNKKQWDLCDEFRETFARKSDGAATDRRFRIHFMGIWDTVSSVGWVWNPASFQFTFHNPGISIIRHAISIDERRAFFRQNRVGRVEGQDLKEYWFPGVHCDVGGGYPVADGGLSYGPFRWILDEACNAGGLHVDDPRLQKLVSEFPGREESWNEKQHESLSGLWWLAEFFPKFPWYSGTRWHWPTLNMGKHRVMEKGDVLHKSALLRIRSENYNPPNFSASLLAEIRDLQEVPDQYPLGSV